MKQVNIYKNEIITNSAQFSSQEEAEQWLNSHIEAGSFGKEEHQDLISAQVLDEDGIELSPAIYETVASEFTFEILDITSQLEQEEINSQSLTYLKSTDWLVIREMDEGTPCSAEIKTERAAARARIVR